MLAWKNLGQIKVNKVTSKAYDESSIEYSQHTKSLSINVLNITNIALSNMTKRNKIINTLLLSLVILSTTLVLIFNLFAPIFIGYGIGHIFILISLLLLFVCTVINFGIRPIQIKTGVTFILLLSNSVVWINVSEYHIQSVGGTMATLGILSTIWTLIACWRQENVPQSKS